MYNARAALAGHTRVFQVMSTSSLLAHVGGCTPIMAPQFLFCRKRLLRELSLSASLSWGYYSMGCDVIQYPRKF